MTRNEQTRTAVFDDVQSSIATEMAIRCQVGDKNVWVPKSIIHDDSEVWQADQYGTLVIPEWFAINNGLV